MNNRTHSFYSDCLNSLAILYWNMGHHEKTEPLWLEAKAIREKSTR
ncbi:MAG: tetratricopeptide repeat protein [Saprospirales bacterium]|nr:tetratricopeptide repeat protein [Saprospirales bacterium]